MGLNKDGDEDFDCSYQDPDYQESREANLISSSSDQECPLEESFMSGKGRGVKRKKGAGGGRGRGAGRGVRVVAGPGRHGRPKKKNKGVEKKGGQWGR